MKKINQKIIAFQNTYYYPLLVAVVVFICHSLSQDLVGFSILTVMLVYTLTATDDTIKIIPILIFGVFTISSNNTPYGGVSSFYSKIFNIVWLTVSGVLILAALIYRWIRTGKKTIKSLKLIYGLIALCLVYFLGGIFYKDYQFDSLLIAGLFTVLILGLYYFFATTVKWNKDSFNYICNIMTIGAMLIICQLAFLYITNSALRQTFNKGYIVLGWGISNIIAAILITMLPFVLYQMSVKKKGCVFYFIVSVMGFLAVTYTLSRTSLTACALCYLAVLVYNVIWGANRRVLRICYAIALAMMGITAAVFYDKIVSSLHFFIESGLNDSGRFDLYKLAIKIWLKNPIFGTGLKYINPDVDLKFWFLRYHNHWLQFLASTGIVGLAAYIFHRFQTLRLIFKKPTKKSLFILLSLAMFIYTSMLDVNMFNPAALFQYGIIMACLELNKKQEDIERQEIEAQRTTEPVTPAE